MENYITALYNKAHSLECRLARKFEVAVKLIELRHLFEREDDLLSFVNRDLISKWLKEIEQDIKNL